MSLSLNKPKLDNLAGHIWKIQIARHLGRMAAIAASLEARLESQIDTLTPYRNSLIHECVTGRRGITKQDLLRAGRVHAAPQPDLESLAACP